jgi:hypothetical protein
MYVVHVNDGSRTATIHLVGGCGAQGKPSATSAGGLDLWSYPISSLREARDCALLARKEQTVLCQVCEQTPGFGA